MGNKINRSRKIETSILIQAHINIQSSLSSQETIKIIDRHKYIFTIIQERITHAIHSNEEKPNINININQNQMEITHGSFIYKQDINNTTLTPEQLKNFFKNNTTNIDEITKANETVKQILYAFSIHAEHTQDKTTINQISYAYNKLDSLTNTLLRLELENSTPTNRQLRTFQKSKEIIHQAYNICTAYLTHN